MTHKIDTFKDEEFYSKDRGYRLADSFYGLVATDEGRHIHMTQFKDSIGTTYIKRIESMGIPFPKRRKPPGPSKEHWEELKKILDLKCTCTVFECVMHVRIGDAFKTYNYKCAGKGCMRSMTVKDLYDKGTDYIKPLSFYEKISDELIKRNILQITVVVGMHERVDANTFKKSKDYMRKIESIFTKKNIDIAYQVGGDADTTFCQMTNSKIFIPSGGGFSRIAKGMVRLYGGEVLEL